MVRGPLRARGTIISQTRAQRWPSFHDRPSVPCDPVGPLEPIHVCLAFLGMGGVRCLCSLASRGKKRRACARARSDGALYNHLQRNGAHPANDGRELRSVGHGRVHLCRRSPLVLVEGGSFQHMIRKRHSRWWTNYNCEWSPPFFAKATARGV